MTEVILGVQFNPLSKLTNAHLGAFWRSLPAGWSEVRDAPLIRSDFEEFSGIRSPERILFEFQVTSEPKSRIQITNPGQSRMLQVQYTRFHLNWLGQQTYPRFEPLLTEFAEHWRAFSEFVAANSLGEIAFNQWEVTYLNQFPKGGLWNSIEEADFFRLLHPPRAGNPKLQADSLSGRWTYEIVPRQGRLHMEFQHRVNEKQEEFIRLNLTARGPVQKTLEQALTGLKLGREMIVTEFQELMSPEANVAFQLEQP